MAWIALTDAEREALIAGLPGGLDGFLKGWGWKHFAEAIDEKLREKNEDGPREVRYECREHGIWNALRESGCPRCVESWRTTRERIIEALDIEMDA